MRDRWRLDLAQTIARAYAADPNAEVVMIAGSVGRGTDDRFSDIEVDVYYARPPTPGERAASVERSGATLAALDEDSDEWEEQMLFGSFRASSSTFLVTTMERYLHEVVERAEPAALAQVRLSSLQNAKPVKGHDRIKAWRTRAGDYPDALVHAMLDEYLPMPRLADIEAVAARGDVLYLNRILSDVTRQILGVLLAVNRTYLPTPEHLKRANEVIAGLRHHPRHLAARLANLYRVEPTAAASAVRELTDEVFALVDEHVPDFDTTPLRAQAVATRLPWDAPPDHGAAVEGAPEEEARSPAQRPHELVRPAHPDVIDKIAWIHLDAGRILSTRSRDKDTYYLPGGKREPGETDIQTLLREVYEELGVTLDVATAHHFGTFEAQAHGLPPGVRVRMTCYTAEHAGTPEPYNEIAEVAWLSYADRDVVAPVDQLIFDHLKGTGFLT